MELTPFKFSDYKSYIKTWLSNQPHQGHGLKSVLAKAAQCNPAYMTQVLSDEAQLSLEQAERLHKVFGLSSEELEFFLLLVEKERAGTSSLRDFFNKKIAAILKQRAQLKNRIQSSVDLTKDVQVKYFSSWIYAAVHVATTIPRLNSMALIAKELKLEQATVREALQFLERHGLIEQSEKSFKPGQARMHLPHDSDLISKHHQNWRVESLKALGNIKETDLHYSSIVSISKKDFIVIREILLNTIQASKETIRSSSEEILASFCVDFFNVSSDERIE